MDLVRVGEFVLAYLPNPTSYRLMFKRMCKSIVTTPSDLELWTREISYVSWIWHVGEFVLAYLLNPTSYGHETCTIGYSKD